MEESLEVGAVYVFKSSPDGKATHFTIFENHTNHLYTVFTHDRNEITQWNLRDWYRHLIKLT